MISNSIELVCFDLGGVVIRICRSWAEGCDAVGLEVRGDVDTLFAGSDGWRELNGAYQCGQIDEDEFAARFSRLVSGLYTAEEIIRVHRAWTRGTYAGVDGVVERLHNEGVATAVLSNTCREHWEDLVQVPVVQTMRHLFASHLLAARKPDPTAYRAVESGTGFTAEEVLFFDDLAENVAAARKVGWNAERIDPHGCPATQIDEALARYGVIGEQRSAQA